MSEIKDPAIKLFGKTIPLSEKSDHLASAPDSSSQTQSDEKDACGDAEHAVDHMTGPAEEPCERKCSSVLSNSKEEDNSQALLQDNKTMAEPTPEENMETDSSSQEKALKKPDKILPCPRCNSLDTKFCYYNNYNVNQPRHFCKNCQRYWTAGGTMRNVPVGAGRRKNKHANSHYRPIVMSSDRIPNAPDAGDNQALLSGICTPRMPVTGNGTILKFGPDAPLCESMANMLNLGDPKRNVEMGVHCGENGEDPSCGPSMSTPTCLEKELPKHMDKELCKGFTPTHPMQCYGGATWPYPYPWNLSSTAAGRCSSELAYGPEAGNLSAVQWGLPQMMATPPFCAPNIPFPLVAAHPSYWGCMSGWPGGPWSVPWVPPNGWVSPSFSSNNGCSGNGSPTLGKHSRDGNLQSEEKPEKCLWVPKTLRIDDPDEAAKSSIWTTLGIKPEQNESINKGGLFKSYKPNVVDQEHISDASQVLQANPAALSRSQTFQESNT